MEILGSPYIVKDWLYCGGPCPSLYQWVNSASRSTTLLSSCAQFRDRQVFGTYSGRSAAALACKTLGLAAGDEILVPTYNCGTEIDALIYAGAKLVFYDVSRKCEIDLESLMARKTSRTRAVYLIHYFGWEQPMRLLRQWCDSQGLWLIEDCALALFSQGASGGIGQTGDAAVFSIPKTLGTLHGGLLSLSKAHPIQFSHLTPADRTTLRNEILHSARAAGLNVAESLGLQRILFAARRRMGSKDQPQTDDATLSPMPPDYYFDASRHANRSLHPRVLSMVRSVSITEIVARRRLNYLSLASALCDIPEVKLLYPQLAEGVCPLSLPLLVGNRSACIEALLAKGIAAHPWWAGFHRSGLNWSDYPDACFLKKHLLTLPVHQGLADDHMRYIATTVIEVIKDFGRSTDRLSISA